MKVAILDTKNQISSDELAAHVQLKTSIDDVINVESDSIDALVIMGGLEEAELTQVFEGVKDSVWKLFLDMSYEGVSSLSALGTDVVVELFEKHSEVTVLQTDLDSTSLRRHGVDLSEVADYDIAENKRIQMAVDKVYKDREIFMSDDNNDESGLSFNMPDNDEIEDATKHDISLELGDSDDSDEVEEAPVDDSNDLDLGEMSSPNISLSDSDDEILNEDTESDDGMDLGDISNAGLSLSEDGDELDNAAVDDDHGSDLDLDMGSDTELALSEEGDEIDNAGIDADSGSDLDLDAEDSSEDLDLGADLDDGLDVGMDDDLDDLDSLEASDDLGDLDDLGDDLDDLGDDIGETTGATVVATLTDVKPVTEEDLSLSDEGDDDLSLSEEDITDPEAGEMTKTVGTETFNTKLNIMLGDEQTETITATQDNLVAQASASSDDATKTLSNVEIPPAPRETQHIVEESITDGQLLTSLSSNELLDLRVTLKELKEDRQNLLGQINTHEEEKSNLKQDNLNLKADIDELKIEISILKKRHLAELEDLKHKLNLASEKKEILEAKNKSYQKEMDRLGQKIRVDFGKIKQREKDLESQLELVTMDADSKVKSRDMKILELKRKIDSLEFNMENISIKERQSRKDRTQLEDKLNKVVGTLRHSLTFLEEEIDIEDITKDLDL
jgi:hypothetical protein